MNWWMKASDSGCELQNYGLKCLTGGRERITSRMRKALHVECMKNMRNQRSQILTGVYDEENVPDYNTT
jgi:hypothetical protein